MTDHPLLRLVRTRWGVRIVLDRADKLNALSHDLVEALDRAISAATDDVEVRVIVIEGAGRAFSAGYDLNEEVDEVIDGPLQWRNLLERDIAATLRVWDCPKPVIAQVHGYCLAGGLELAMACDLIVAAEGTKLGEPEIRYGSAPVTLLMPALVGQKKTRELLLTGDLIDAAEAERIGLVNRVVPANRLAAEVDDLADRIARTPPEVLRLTKQMLNRAMEAAGLREAIAAGLDLGAIINSADTPEQREWDEIVRRDGLKAALAWRDRRYEAEGAGPSEGTVPRPSGDPS
jgi:enoyl-CoA hydratase/carnithine racemase